MGKVLTVVASDEFITLSRKDEVVLRSPTIADLIAAAHALGESDPLRLSARDKVRLDLSPADRETVLQSSEALGQARDLVRNRLAQAGVDVFHAWSLAASPSSSPEKSPRGRDAARPRPPNPPSSVVGAHQTDLRARLADVSAVRGYHANHRFITEPRVIRKILRHLETKAANPRSPPNNTSAAA